MIELIDLKGDYWYLIWTGGTNINTITGTMESLWHVIEGPPFLNQNGADYNWIPTPIFMEWF